MAARTILEATNWYGFEKELAPQTVPTVDELKAEFRVDETGSTIEEHSDYDPETDSLPEGRDKRTWAIDSPEGRTNVLFVPDRHGFYIENSRGQKWRPSDINELRDVLNEMDFQIYHYDDLL